MSGCQSHLHLGLLHIAVDQSGHVAEGGLPRLPVQQDVVEDFKKVTLTSQHILN